MTDLVVAATGTANLASVWSALERLGARPVLARGPEDVRAARRIVLPGVGTFRAAMEQLARDGLVDALRAHAAERRPTLAVCLGFQLLFEASAESPGVDGLGVWARSIDALPAGMRCPHLGWNAVEPSAGCRWLRPGEAYFAHSFWAKPNRELPSSATTTYGEPFVAAIEDGGILATQFHPELSGPWGLALLRAWLEAESC